MISKELMSEVLNLNITYIERCNNSIIYKISVYDREEEVNIYELAYKCKEWAFGKGYEFRTSIRGIVDVYDHIYIHKEDGKTGEFIDCRQEADTEYEAIFKACQWILDNKDK